IGGATAPVSRSGSAPACTASVSNFWVIRHLQTCIGQIDAPKIMERPAITLTPARRKHEISAQHGARARPGCLVAVLLRGPGIARGASQGRAARQVHAGFPVGA